MRGWRTGLIVSLIGGLAAVVVAAVVAVTVGRRDPRAPRPDAPSLSTATGPLVVSALPRLRLLWAVPEITLAYWPYSDDTRVFDGALFGWRGSGTDKSLVAIEAATGQDRWSIPAPDGHEAQVEFAKGLVLLNSAGGATRALDIKTGRLLWTAHVCSFYDVVRDNGTTGFVRCRGPDDITKVDGEVYSTHRTAFLIGFDLVDGRVLWRRDSTRAQGGGVGGLGAGSPAIGARTIHLANQGKIVTLDPLTGEVRRTLEPPAGQSWLVTAVEPAGRDLALLTKGLGVFSAIRLLDGSEVWTQPKESQGPWLTSGGFAAALEQGRIVQMREREIITTQLDTGRVMSRCALPDLSTLGYTPPKRWYLMQGKVVAVGAPHGSPAIVLRCDPQGGSASPAVPPPPKEAPTSVQAVAAAHEGTLIFRVDGQLVGYAAFETGASERAAMAPRARIIAIVNRAMVHPDYVASTIGHNQALFEELRQVPGYQKELLALATDAGFPGRLRALDAATALRVPGIVPQLLDEIFRPLSPPPPLTVQQAFQYRSKMRHEPTHYAYRQAVERRADQVVLLAALNDPTTASRLGPLLTARSTPAALGWRDWNVWGTYLAGLGAWDAQSNTERLLHLLGNSADGGHSESLPASCARPQMHAAIYRMLARLGGAENLARLDAFDADTARPGGWATICDADDGVTQKPVEPVSGQPWGICSGVEVGALRVTQARDQVWLRRPVSGGGYGPPAWADDLGGGNCHTRHLVKAARMSGGRIVLQFDGEHAFVGGIDRARTFADSDGDGLSDRTEAAFGTDPHRPDSDGDGIADGRDPAPLAGPPGDARAEVVGEMLRYAARFFVGGPLVFQADRALWSDAANPVGLLLHMPPEVALDDETCASKPKRYEPPPKLRRIPFPVIHVESLRLAGDRASGRIIWSIRDTHQGRDLEMKQVGGKWRVVEDMDAGSAGN